MKKNLCLCLMMLLVVNGCSTRPRDFAARLSAAPASQDIFTRDFAMCKLMVDRGVTGKFKDQFAANAAAATGVAVGAVASSVAVSSSIAAGLANGFSAALGSTGTATGSATASTLSVAAPAAGILVSVAISRALKGKREKQVKSAMADCLAEAGYIVAGWTPDNRVLAIPASLPTDKRPETPTLAAQ